MYRVYAALKKEINIKPIIVIPLHLTNLTMRLISPSKFKVGGAAIFPTLNKNHHSPILGNRFNKPLLIKSLRLPTRSYIMLARQKRPEEHKP